MSPTQGQAILLGATPYQPFRRTHRHGCMAGYHCLMPTAFLLVRNNLYLSSCDFPLHCKTKHAQRQSPFLPSQLNTNLTPDVIPPIKNNTRLIGLPEFGRMKFGEYNRGNRTTLNSQSCVRGDGTTGAKKGEREIPCLNRLEMILQTLPGQFGDDGNL